METLVSRVLWLDHDPKKEILLDKYIDPFNIVDLQESLRGKKYTTVLLTTDEITVKSPLNKFRNYIINEKQRIEDEEGKRREQVIGYQTP